MNDTSLPAGDAPRREARGTPSWLSLVIYLVAIVSLVAAVIVFGR